MLTIFCNFQVATHSILKRKKKINPKQSEKSLQNCTVGLETVKATGFEVYQKFNIFYGVKLDLSEFGYEY